MAYMYKITAVAIDRINETRLMLISKNIKQVKHHKNSTEYY